MTETFPSHRLWELEDRYRGSFEVDELSYGTVRDLADSRDRLGGLARANSDMKDLQRCWIVKAVLGNVEPGGRLIEIGAGEPLVADLLSRLGYRVTVVDPYDGSGHGPTQFEQFRAAHPDVDFIRERFPPTEGLPAGVAASTRSRSSSTSPWNPSAPWWTPRRGPSPAAAARFTPWTTSWRAGEPKRTGSAWRRSSGGPACRWSA